MSGPPPLRVRYNRVVAVGSVTLGLVCLVLGVWVGLLGDFTPAVVVGFFPLLTGIVMLLRPYFTVESGMVRIQAMIGSGQREFRFDSLIVDRRLLTVVSDTDGRRRVPVSRWMSRGADWALITEPPRPSASTPTGP
jgi:hypothetical protein